MLCSTFGLSGNGAGVIQNSNKMELQEYAAMRELEQNGNKHWGATTAIWVLVAAVIIVAIVYNWTRNCNEKVQFSTALANLNGRVSCMEPSVRWAGEQLYTANGTIQSLDRGVRDMGQNFGEQLFQLNDEVFYNPNQCGCGRGRNRSGCGGCGSCGGREFRQTSTYNLASTNVTVDETCRN